MTDPDYPAGQKPENDLVAKSAATSQHGGKSTAGISGYGGDEGDEDMPGNSGKNSVRAGLGFMLFALGIACGIPAAIFMPSFLEDHGTTVMAIILGALLFAAVLLALVFIFREPLWRWLFSRGNIEVSRFAGPLADVARFAAEKRVDEATGAARTFAEIALARYAWITTRRWLVASITALVAAIAALAGSALLFEQNKLLRAQSGLLEEQNARILQQNSLIDTQIQLAEAERSAQVGPEIVEIGALIAEERQAFLDGGGDINAFTLDDLSSKLRGRMVAATLVARPYRYLSPANVNPRDADGLNRKAIARRPEILADPSILDDGTMRAGGQLLIDRPISPERGDLLGIMVGNSLISTERLSALGADFSFAEYRREVAPGISLQHGKLAFADFSWTRVVQCRFGAAQLDHARFEKAVIRQSDFSSIAAKDVSALFLAGDFEYLPTQMAGISFRDSVVHETAFRRVQGNAPVFDNAVVSKADFSHASIGGASFRDAIIIDVSFEGAALQSIDLQGAIVFEQTFVNLLAEQAMTGTFVADRWQLSPISASEVAEHARYYEMQNHVEQAAYVGKQAFRISRVEGK